MVTKARQKLKRVRKYNAFDIFVVLFCTLCALICVYPMWYVLIVSITPYEEFIKKSTILLPPLKPDFQYYKAILTSSLFQQSIMISVFKTVTATVLSVIVTSMMAYGVSKTHIKGMKLINFLVVCTLYFNGGLIPTYFLYRDLLMIKTILPMILPAAVNVTYFIIMRNYFNYSVSLSIEEAAIIDGANQATIFFKLILPISAPMVAAVSLFIAVTQWNDYYQYLMFVNKPNLQPYVWVLRRMLVDHTFTNTLSANAQAQLGIPHIPAFALRMATIITAMTPIIIVYPFLQKHFAQGMMIGAVKG